MEDFPVVLITGGAKRIGACIASTLHQQFNILLHFNQSQQEATALAQQLNHLRKNSCHLVQADLTSNLDYQQFIAQSIQPFGRLDLLINNASHFYETPIGQATEQHWHELIGSNLKAPFFLSQACVPYLSKASGQIINLVDIHAQKPLPKHSIYSVAKAGLVMLTQSLAIELGPNIRVNAIAPGIILWPNTQLTLEQKQQALQQIPLQQEGSVQDIANTIKFLACEGKYINGQVIAVDGGRSLHTGMNF